MTATLAETRADVRDHLDELVPAFYPDLTLDRWIYEGARDVARRGEVLQDVQSYTLQADQVNYDAPPDMVRIHRVEYRQSTSYVYALEYRTIDSMDDVWFTSREVAGSLPEYWSFWGTPGIASSQIYIYPIVSNATADGLRVFYYRLPHKPEVDTDPVEVPAGWEDLVVLYCEMNALRRAGSARWQEAQTMYEARLLTLIEVTRQFTDQQTLISGAGMGSHARFPFANDPWW